MTLFLVQAASRFKRANSQTLPVFNAACSFAERRGQALDMAGDSKMTTEPLLHGKPERGPLKAYGQSLLARFR